MNYAPGLGLPLLLLVVGLEAGEPRGRLVRLLRGRDWELRLGRYTMHIHSTSAVSGLLTTLVGLLLVTGQMTLLGQQLAGSDPSQWAVALEGWFDGVMRDVW